VHGTATTVVIFAVHPVATDATHKPSSVATTVAVIPVRYDSTRLPGKPLADIAGQTMIERVYRRAQRARSVDKVIIATDDSRIAEAVQAFGGEIYLTRSDHLTGSDRLAEVAESLTCDLIVNVQGDEPLLDPCLIDAVLSRLQADPPANIVTARCAITMQSEFTNPNIVKVVVTADDYALYFSRAPIPQHRGESDESPTILGYKHIGLYAYQRTTLLELNNLQPTVLEKAEQLEQLRALQYGYRIATIETDTHSLGVDTPEDLDEVRRLVSTGANE
jgi:3-deoxy-manno-octulosonate cytidylyltransferase (CMP-KDO synthetase)|tara:strand:- start:492 stop:1319 length:828 start_codon:yes stop_codon:yes gene_type:complete